MSGFVCPKCGEITNIFNVGGGEKMANEMGINFLGRIPIESDIVKASDEGKPYISFYEKTNTAKSIKEILDRITSEND